MGDVMVEDKNRDAGHLIRATYSFRISTEGQQKGYSTRNDLRAKVVELDGERDAAQAELGALRGSREEIWQLEKLPDLAGSYARDLPVKRLVRGA